MNDMELPEISIIIPCLNEEKFIAQCLESLLRQDYPLKKIEIIVMDGMSSDNTRRIVSDFAVRYPNVRLLDNPARFIPHAMNRGIKEARADFIVRADAHAVYDYDYIKNCVRLLIEGKADNVGGVLRAEGTNYLSNAIALATTNPFGVGNAYYRYSGKERYVDTLFPGAWRKETLLKLGGFNEAWIVNQDYELNYRLRASGGRILLSPDIKCTYFVRPSLWQLIRQYFRYGKWRVKTFKRHPGSLAWRQIIPPLFVFVFLISIISAAFYPWPGSIVPAAYLLANVSASLFLSIKKGFQYFPALILIFFCMHFAWGLGFWHGLAIFEKNDGEQAS